MKQKFHLPHCDLVSNCLPTTHMVTASKSDFPHTEQFAPIMLVADHICIRHMVLLSILSKEADFLQKQLAFIWNVCYNNDISYIYIGYKNNEGILTLYKCSQ
jgi:hypothetical protein